MQRAFDLYQWNTALNSAFLHDFAHFEIALRNALDKQLCSLMPPNSGLHWTRDPALPMYFPVDVAPNGADRNEWIRKEVIKADTKMHRPRHGVNPPHNPGKIIADLSLGVWVDMLHGRNENRLWARCLHAAFEPGTDRAQLYQTLRDLNDFRNRVAHHEHTLTGAELARRKLISTLKRISPAVAEHTSRHSSVPSILKAKP